MRKKVPSRHFFLQAENKLETKSSPAAHASVTAKIAKSRTSLAVTLSSQTGWIHWGGGRVSKAREGGSGTLPSNPRSHPFRRGKRARMEPMRPNRITCRRNWCGKGQVTRLYGKVRTKSLFKEMLRINAVAQPWECPRYPTLGRATQATATFQRHWGQLPRVIHYR